MDPINVTITQPAPINVDLGPGAAEVDVTVGLGSPGIPGPQGARGATFLGGYPTFGNLPTIDGVGVKDGDFALVQDTCTIYQIK